MTETLIRRQFELEEEMRNMGIDRYRKRKLKAEEYGTETDISPVNYLMRKAISPMTEAITKFLADAQAGLAGRNNTAARYITGMEPEVVALITAKSVLDSLSRKVNLQTACVKIGGEIESELWFKSFSTQKPGLWNKIIEGMAKEQTGGSVKQARMKRAAIKYDIEFTQWSRKDALLVGLKLFRLLQETCGFCQEVTTGVGKDMETTIEATPEVDVWLKEAHTRAEALSPIYLPMICRPRDWTTPWDGGYVSNICRRRPLIHTRNSDYLEEVANSDIDRVYESVNTLQRTGWRVSRKVFEVIKTLYDSQSQLGKLPSIRDDDVPPYPANKEDEEAVTRWRVTARGIKEGNAKRRSKRIALAMAINTAARFKDEEAVFFPYYLDFRGRAYPQASYLNPQGADFAKAMLEFSEGMALGEQGACWLAIHGANTYGYDKADLQTRIDWVVEHETEILACAAEPLDCTWWAAADKPYQFLAFCLEWAGYKAEGEAFISHIPVALDGSCNGLQNFSMALRDEVGGAAVNLVPMDTPADVYQRVADVVLEKLRDASAYTGVGPVPAAFITPKAPKEGEEDKRKKPLTIADQVKLAKQWAESGLVNRKLCKGPVMTLPYGAKQFGMRSGVAEYLREQRDEGKTLPWSDDNLFGAAVFITGLIWKSITEVVVAARHAMDFLQKTASVASREELPIHWLTPDGLPVLQEYRKLVGKFVDTTVNGSRIRLALTEGNGPLDKRRQASGISPNFVHSLDASHMRMTTLTCADNDIMSLAMIHDSFGTHAANTELLGVCLRNAFVEMYRADVLSDFRETIVKQLSEKNAAEVPPCPEKGSLDVKAVLESAFFFA
jgi:DNA-directed RNA polymerase